MPKLFISYRREDTEFAAHAIFELLAERFGRANVFIDVDAIPPGVDFRDHISEAVGSCDVLLAVIGTRWLEMKEGKERRIDDPQDFVRIEIQSALSRGVPVVPVLVGSHIEMPTANELPEPLRELAFRNAVEVRPGADFRLHVQRLVGGLQHYLAGDAVPAEIVEDTLRIEELERAAPRPPLKPPAATARLSDSRAGPAPPATVAVHAPRKPLPAGTVPTYLGWAIFCLVMCGGIFAVPALIYSLQVNPKLEAGDLEGARRASSNALMWCVIAMVLCLMCVGPSLGFYIMALSMQ